MDVLIVLEEQRAKLQTELKNIDRAIACLNGKSRHSAHEPPTVRKFTMSAAARKRIGRGVRRARKEKRDALLAKTKKAPAAKKAGA